MKSMLPRTWPDENRVNRFKRKGDSPPTTRIPHLTRTRRYTMRPTISATTAAASNPANAASQ